MVGSDKIDKLALFKVVFVHFMFLIAALTHFLVPEFYTRSIPFLPQPELIVFLSGIVELLLAFSVLDDGFREYGSYIGSVFLLAVYPANIYVALNPEVFPEFLPIIIWLRLPIQFFFLWITFSISALKWDDVLKSSTKNSKENNSE